jgi:hypothetical protein
VDGIWLISPVMTRNAANARAGCVIEMRRMSCLTNKGFFED